jgi:three-Cys-motif partner protein
VPVPADVIWECKPHTVAKHRLLERYLEAWYPILMQSRWSSVTYAEGFAGSGVYTNGEPGSPVIAARVFLRRRQFLDNGKRLSMVLVEQDERRLVNLQQEMGKALSTYDVLPPTLKIAYQPGECARQFLPRLKAEGARQGPIFAFLDSFGGPDVPLEIARAIAQVPSSEVLVTFGTTFLTRFGGVVDHQASGDQVFGGPTWRRVTGLPPEEKKPFLIDTYRASLRHAGFRYVTSFEMVDDTGSDLHLVFGTSSRLGLEKMKDAMWNVDPVRGVHYRDPRDPGQLTFDFTPSPDLGPLRRALLAELSRGERTLSQLQDHALLETVYRGPHATKAATSMLGDKLISREPGSGPLRKTTRLCITTHGRLHLQRHQPTLPF